MKTLLTITLAAVLTAAATFAADTPEQIAADYREKSAAAIKRINETLEKAAVPIVADLVKKGDTVGAQTVQDQLKQLMAGEIVMTPHASLVPLAASYGKARQTALAPVQKSTVGRIEALLGTSEGKKLEVVAALGKVREEVEAGRTVAGTPKSIPVEWTYHSTREQQTPMATVYFREDGTFEMTSTAPGKWKSNKAGDIITVSFKDKPDWKVHLGTDTGTIERPDVGTRYLRVRPPSSASANNN